jgi:hypothetical protein
MLARWEQALIGVGAVAGAWATKVAIDFSVTSHGPNPWTLGALLNTLRIARHILAVRETIDGEVTSVYRSPEVNAKLSNASATSRHMEGLAVDCKPGGQYTVEAAARKVAARARRGELGPVRTVIWEPTWVHVDWFRVSEAHAPLVTRKAVGSGAGTTYESVVL